ncbi:MAG: LCP family protein [Cyanothece sp. SIO1E1]|nr:LCP family protein [Cyanothece sp. SIO1E1]
MEQLKADDTRERPIETPESTVIPIEISTRLSSPKPITRPSRATKIAQGLFWGAIFFTTASISAVMGASFALVTPLPESFISFLEHKQLPLGNLGIMGLTHRITQPVNILVMGVDRVLDAPNDSPAVLAGRTDTMLLVRVNPIDGTINVLSIPRDTQVVIPGAGLTKINHANVLGGPSLAAQIVSRNLADVKIDRYVRVSTAAFRELVDLVGGVEVFVPQRMEYVDRTQNLEIDLMPGWQTLNGDQAEQFARFRNHDNGDVGRVQRQQILIRALRERLMSPAVIPQIPQMIQLVKRYLDTNLSLDEMLALASFGVNLERDSFRMILLPGRFSHLDEYKVSYWIMNETESERLISQYFQADAGNFRTYDREPIIESRIAIQNASGNSRASRQIAQYLQDQGFNNVYVIPDWPDQEHETQVIAQQGDLEGATVVESILGFGEVVSASIGDLNSDLTIRVGEDWLYQLIEAN